MHTKYNKTGTLGGKSVLNERQTTHDTRQDKKKEGGVREVVPSKLFYGKGPRELLATETAWLTIRAENASVSRCHLNIHVLLVAGLSYVALPSSTAFAHGV